MENQGASPDFCQRATAAAIGSAVLYQPGKVCAPMVAAHGQIEGSEEHKPTSLDRADGHTRSVVAADIQEAVAKNLHARMATSRIIAEENRAAFAGAVLSHHRGIARAGISEETGAAAECAADCATVVS